MPREKIASSTDSAYIDVSWGMGPEGSVIQIGTASDREFDWADDGESDGPYKGLYTHLSREQLTELIKVLNRVKRYAWKTAE